MGRITVADACIDSIESHAVVVMLRPDSRSTIIESPRQPGSS
jgi:hypothetical protein